MDLNRTAIEAGSRAFDLDLRVADETALANIPNRSFDISFTASVLDHIALPAHTIARLAAITQRFSITYEICCDKTGKIQSMQDATGTSSTPTHALISTIIAASLPMLAASRCR